MTSMRRRYYPRGNAAYYPRGNTYGTVDTYGTVGTHGIPIYGTVP